MAKVPVELQESLDVGYAELQGLSARIIDLDFKITGLAIDAARWTAVSLALAALPATATFQEVEAAAWAAIARATVAEMPKMLKRIAALKDERATKVKEHNERMRQARAMENE